MICNFILYISQLEIQFFVDFISSVGTKNGAFWCTIFSPFLFKIGQNLSKYYKWSPPPWVQKFLFAILFSTKIKLIIFNYSVMLLLSQKLWHTCGQKHVCQTFFNNIILGQYHILSICHFNRGLWYGIMPKIALNGTP